LQSSDEDPDTVPDQDWQVQSCNWQVVNCTTPANYFHVLRRQVKRDFRKPLIVMSPKNLLRLRECASPLEDISTSKRFKRVISEPYLEEELVPREQIRRLVFCSGKIYYELLAGRRKGEIKDVAIVRLEQITPFPFDRVAEEVAWYPNAEVVWAQEEPKNMGCWSYVCDRIMTATRVLNKSVVLPAYVGRGTMASTAEGYGAVHGREQASIIQTALSDGVTAYGHGREVKWGMSSLMANDGPPSSINVN
jgi:2-oxoglutarate dehydrogenase E1 component